MTALTLILVPMSVVNLEYASAEASAEPKLWVAEASIRPKLKIIASFVHYLSSF